MPFANKFKLAMNMPEPGDTIGRFMVETCEVGHVGIHGGRYEYPVEMILAGKGGQQGARNDLKALLSKRKTTFSGYGNPYQLAFDRVVVESLGDSRYKVTVSGIGNRVYIKKELLRFLEYFQDADLTAVTGDETKRSEIVDAYLAAYQADARRKTPHLPC